MFRSLSSRGGAGFTLVEVLVTTVVVGVMAAVVFPAVVKRTTAADSARVAQDLVSVKGAAQIFSEGVRPRMPGDIEDLTNAISTTESGMDGTGYSAAHVAAWDGPYLEWTTTAIANATSADEVLKSGGSAVIHNAFFRCPAVESGYSAATGDLPCTLFTTTTGNETDAYGAVKVSGIGFASNEFLNLNHVIDGRDEGGSDTDRQNMGLLRQNASGTVFFLAVPFQKP